MSWVDYSFSVEKEYAWCTVIRSRRAPESKYSDSANTSRQLSGAGVPQPPFCRISPAIVPNRYPDSIASHWETGGPVHDKGTIPAISQVVIVRVFSILEDSVLSLGLFLDTDHLYLLLLFLYIPLYSQALERLVSLCKFTNRSEFQTRFTARANLFYLSRPLGELLSFHSCGAYPSFTFIMYIQLCGHWAHKEGHYATTIGSSSWDLESTNASVCLIFKLPSASVTMCTMRIDS